MAWYLTREYGDSIQVNYNDLSRASVKQKFPTMVEKLEKGELVLPVVFVDDEVASLGYVDYLSIHRSVQKVRAAQSSPGQ